LSALTQAHPDNFSFPSENIAGLLTPAPPAVQGTGGSCLDKFGTAPDTPLTATSLTLPCHKVELPPVVAQARLCTLFENACQGLSIMPAQLLQELEENGDLPDLVCGALTPKALKLTARALALMRYPNLPGRR